MAQIDDAVIESIETAVWRLVNLVRFAISLWIRNRMTGTAAGKQALKELADIE
jgi:hypothetical protein